MTLKNDENLGKLAGVLAIIIAAYYITGLYRNLLEIKELKPNKKDENNNTTS